MRLEEVQACPWDCQGLGSNHIILWQILGSSPILLVYPSWEEAQDTISWSDQDSLLQTHKTDQWPNLLSRHSCGSGPQPLPLCDQEAGVQALWLQHVRPAWHVVQRTTSASTLLLSVSCLAWDHSARNVLFFLNRENRNSLYFASSLYYDYCKKYEETYRTGIEQ